jgi:hypothetical protein
MPIPPHRLARRVAALLCQREKLRAQAPAFTLRFYRKHRRLPPAYVLVLLSATTVRRIRLRGEIEHVFGIAEFFSMEKANLMSAAWSAVDFIKNRP